MWGLGKAIFIELIIRDCNTLEYINFIYTYILIFSLIKRMLLKLKGSC